MHDRSRGKIRSINLPSLRGQQVHLPDLLADEEKLEQWQRIMHADTSLIALDLFCGAGGMSLGFEDAGFVIAAGIDSDPIACETYAANLLSKLGLHRSWSRCETGCVDGGAWDSTGRCDRGRATLPGFLAGRDEYAAISGSEGSAGAGGSGRTKPAVPGICAVRAGAAAALFRDGECTGPELLRGGCDRTGDPARLR